MSPITKTMQVLRAKQVQKKLQISNGSFYAKINPKSKYYDPTFPRHIRLGIRSVGWIEADIDAWLSSRVLCADARA